MLNTGRGLFSNKKSYTLLYIAVVVTAIIGLYGCDDNRIYSHYEHLELSGWERNDTTVFAFPCKKDGTYSLDIGFRANQEFPYKTISMVIERTVFPSGETNSSTIRCRIIDDNGYMVGKRGISNCEIKYNLGKIILKANDSVRIKINHCMRRESIPGLSEIGIEARKL